MLIADTSLDTSTDSICNGGVVPQSLAPEICILRYGSITVPTGVTLKVTGTRALALVADDRLSVDGVLDISADESRSPTYGPGGGGAISGGVPDNHLGGGGAGFRTAGAPGGSATTSGGAANGGAAINPLVNPALVAGPSANGYGAGGGGGATLISCRGSISLGGTIDAGGAGGDGGFQDLANNHFIGGTGGGAGGYVVLQARAINVTGRVYANGGGGGAGLGGPAAPGADGNRSVFRALGGGTYPNQSAGGPGAAAMGSADIGILATSSTASPGGGGGSMGFFQTYTPAGFTPSLTPTEASPGFEPNLTIDTR